MSLKKTLSVFLSVTTMVWLLGPAIAFGAVVINDGDLIRGPDGITVYIVKPSVHGAFSGFKRHIFNPAVFNMYGHFNWNNIKAVDQVQLDSYQTSDIYRVLGDTKVYGMEEVDMVAGIAHKRWVNMTAEEYIAKGYTWEQIFTINTAEGNYYTTGTDITYSGSPAPITGGALNVSLASTTPASKVVADNTAYNDVLTLNVSAGSQAASVTGVTFTKYGLLANTAVNGVSVWDAAGVRHGNIMTSWTSDNKVTISFAGSPINVPANSSTTLKLAVNVGEADSGTMYFGVTSASDVASGGSVGGTFPIMGNVMSMANGAASLGSVAVVHQAGSGNAAETDTANVNIGDTGKELTKVQLTAGANEDIVLKKLVVYVSGSFIEATDLKNFKLYDAAGNVLASVERSSDRYATFNLANPYLITKGSAKTLTVKVDVTDGSTRTFRGLIQNDYDMMVQGTTTGFYLLPTGTFPGAPATAWYKVKSGDLSIQKTSASASGQVAPAATNVELAQYDLRATGENLEVRKVQFKVTRVADAPVLAGTLKVQNSAGTETYLSVSGGTGLDTLTEYSLSAYFTLMSNETKTIRFVGDIGTTATSGSYTVNLRDFYVKRLSTNDYQNKPTTSSNTDANTLAVSASTLTIAKNTAIGAKTLAKGSTGAIIGSYAFQAGSAEDVRVSSINLGFVAGQGTPSTDLTNLSIWDGSTQLGSTIGVPTDPTSTNSFSVNLLVPKSTTKIIDVKANITNAASASALLTTQLNTGTVTGTAVLSGNTVTAPEALKTGQVITVGAGSLAITKDSSSTGSKILTAGLSGVELEKLNFAALTENLTVTKLTVQVNGAPENYGMIYLKDGSTTIGSTALMSSQATFTGLNILVPADGTKVIGVYADITGSGTMTAGSTSSVQLVTTSTPTYFIVNKASGGTLASVANSTQSATYLFHNVAPVVAKHASSPSGTLTPSANQEIFRFSVTAQGVRDMNLASMAVVLSQSGMAGLGAVNTLELWDYDLSTKLATNAAAVASSSASWNIWFGDQNEVNAAFPLTISAGATKTFSVKANTSAILTGVAAGNSARLTLSVDGTTGFSSLNAVAEADWTEGGVFYKYTPIGGTINSTAYQASDSYPVSGNTLTYSN